MDKINKTRRRCCVTGCRSWKKYDTADASVNVFRFPSCQERSAEWLRAIGNEELWSMPTAKLHQLRFVCEKHFRKKDMKQNRRRVLLAAGAVPCLFQGSTEGVQNDIVGEDTTLPSNASIGARKEKSDFEVVAHIDALIVQNETVIHKRSQDIPPPVNSQNSAAKEITVEDEGLLNDPGTNCKVVSNDELMEYVKHQLCRICGMKRDELSSIFCESSSREESHITLEQKIEMYLPIKVCKSDVLPHRICLKCLDLVESWHELYVSCLAADAVLKKTLVVDKPEVSTSEAGCDIFEAEEDENRRMSDKEEIAEDHSSEICEQHIMRINTGSPIPEDEGLNENLKWDHNYYLKSDHLYTKRDSLQCVPSAIKNVNSGKCKYCSLSFRVEEEYIVHERQCALEPAICDICGQTVHERRLLRSHFQKHISEPGLCEKCGSEYSSKQSLKVHKYRCHGKGYVPKHFCEPCCRVVSNQAAFERHQEWHKKKKTLNFRIFSSDLCKVNNCDEHFACPVCKSPFNDKLSLITHMNKMNQTNCANCNAVLRNERDVFRHNCQKLCCRFCSMQFEEQRSFYQHLRFHKTYKDFPCKVCGRKYVSLRSYYRHQLYHQPCKFCCEVCGDQFRIKEKYEDHMRRHNGIKLICLLCDTEFCSSASFYTHNHKYHGGIKIKST